MLLILGCHVNKVFIFDLYWLWITFHFCQINRFLWINMENPHATMQDCWCYPPWHRKSKDFYTLPSVDHRRPLALTKINVVFMPSMTLDITKYGTIYYFQGQIILTQRVQILPTKFSSWPSKNLKRKHLCGTSPRQSCSSLCWVKCLTATSTHYCVQAVYYLLGTLLIHTKPHWPIRVTLLFEFLSVEGKSNC